MNSAAVELLTNTITEMVGQISECRIKLAALERALEDKSPRQYEFYLVELEKLKTHRAFELNLAALANLKSRLLDS